MKMQPPAEAPKASRARPRSFRPQPVLTLIRLALFAADTISAGADLSGMVDDASLPSGIHASLFVLAFGMGKCAI